MTPIEHSPEDLFEESVQLVEVGEAVTGHWLVLRTHQQLLLVQLLLHLWRCGEALQGAQQTGGRLHK